MTDQNPSSVKSVWTRRLLSVAKVVWPGALVFLVFDLSVDRNLSILKPDDVSERPAVPQVVEINKINNGLPAWADDADEQHSPHVMFGVDELVAEMNLGAAVSDLDGGWSGRFASVLEGDAQTDCWSPYEVNLRLRESGDRVYGPGSYIVDPSGCSTHESPYLAFFNAEGTREGNQVTLEIRDDATDEVSLLFSGTATGDRLVGAFLRPDGAPVSGTTILTLVEIGNPEAES